MVVQYVNVSELQFTEGFLKEVILGNDRHVSKHLSLGGSKILNYLGRKQTNMHIYATGNIILIRHQFKFCCLIPRVEYHFKSQLLTESESRLLWYCPY
jgi:hypothetical protein